MCLTSDVLGLDNRLIAWVDPWYYGGPNHDNTTNFGDPILFEYNRTGSQRLVFQPSYWVLGHISRFARPGATVINVTAGPGVAVTNADYEAVRAYCKMFSSIPLTCSKHPAFSDCRALYAVHILS